MRKVYIQQKDGEWLNRNCFASMQGFDFLGYEIVPFEYNDLLDGLLQLNRRTIVHGGVLPVLEALKQIGVPEPPNIDIPESLKEFCGRNIYYITMGDVRKLDTPRFVKPLLGHKDFNGYVVKSFGDLIYTARFENSYQILASDIVNFISEYRFFVLNKKIIGVGHYRGDPLVFPNVDVVRKVLDKYIEQPASYSIDIGITDENKTLLVEINDAFALGAYGLNSVDYARMIEARWDELTLKGIE